MIQECSGDANNIVSVGATEERSPVCTGFLQNGSQRASPPVPSLRGWGPLGGDGAFPARGLRPVLPLLGGCGPGTVLRALVSEAGGNWVRKLHRQGTSAANKQPEASRPRAKGDRLHRWAFPQLPLSSSTFRKQPTVSQECCRARVFSGLCPSLKGPCNSMGRGGDFKNGLLRTLECQPWKVPLLPL